MIVAAGLTPAWQHILVLDDFQPGAVNRARQAHWHASGKVLNVGIAVARLEGPCVIVSVLGGPARESIEQQIDELGISSRFVASLAATRTCTTILDAEGAATELVENAAPLSTSELEETKHNIIIEGRDAEVLVLTGSLPAGTPETLFRDILKEVACRAVLDIRGPELLSALEQDPLVVKPNREELAATLGRPLDSDDALRGAMKELHDRGAQWVVVSDAQRPIWISDSQKVFRIQLPKIGKVVNPIGCGDAMTAGIAWSLRTGREPLEAIRFGVAAARDNVSRLLPGQLDKARIDQLLPSVMVETV